MPMVVRTLFIGFCSIVPSIELVFTGAAAMVAGASEKKSAESVPLAYFESLKD